MRICKETKIVMKKLSIRDLDLEGKRIFVRVDFNVPLNEDGKIPGDNPFHAYESGRKEIFTFGHRNPQGMALHPQTGVVWVHEHGPQGGDEINIFSRLNQIW